MLVLEIIRIFGNTEGEEEKESNDQEFEHTMFQKRRELCHAVDASKGVVFDEGKIDATKVSFKYIQIVTIKATLDFRLEKKQFDFDFSNPRAGFGILGILYPFISSFAQISDAKLKFNELSFKDVYYNQTQLIDNIYNYYWNQGAK